AGLLSTGSPRTAGPQPRDVLQLARPLHRLASDGGDSIADSPRLRLRLALRPRALLRLARPLHRLRLGRRGLNRRLPSPSPAARTAAPRTPKGPPTTAPPG